MIFLRSFLWLGFLLAAVLASVAPGRAATLTLIPAADTSIIESVPDNNLGHAWLTVGTLNNAGRSRSLLRFDLSGLPAGSTLESATLSLAVTKQPPGGASSNFRLHRLLQPWFEGGQGSPGVGVGAPAAAGDTTWNHRASATAAWSSPGAGSPLDFASAPSSSATASSAATISFPSSAQLVADLQAWFQNPASNLGWLIVSDAESTPGTAKRLGSRETTGAEPVLAIQYQPPAPVVTPPSISQQPRGITVNLGAQVGFSVVATGTAPFSYQWQFNGTDIAGETKSELVIPAAGETQEGDYQVRVSNEAGRVLSAPARLAITRTPPAAPRLRDGTLAGDVIRFDFDAEPRRTYVVEVSAAPAEPVWQTLRTFEPQTAARTITVTDVRPAGARFYRVMAR